MESPVATLGIYTLVLRSSFQSEGPTTFPSTHLISIPLASDLLYTLLNRTSKLHNLHCCMHPLWPALQLLFPSYFGIPHKHMQQFQHYPNLSSLAYNFPGCSMFSPARSQVSNSRSMGHIWPGLQLYPAHKIFRQKYFWIACRYNVKIKFPNAAVLLSEMLSRNTPRSIRISEN